MCLAVPARLSLLDGMEAEVDMHGNRVRICTQLVPEAKNGDWVLVHAGFAIQVLNEEEAQETWAILNDLEKANAAEDGRAPRK